jgi:flagellar protein FliS
VNHAHALKAYQSVSNESEKLETDPYKIIAILMNNALLALDNAKTAMVAHHIEEKGRNISLAISLIDGLNASLDTQQGEIAENLAKLYDYMMRRLVEANLHNQESILEEIRGLLLEIKDSWDAINPHA